MHADVCAYHLDLVMHESNANLSHQIVLGILAVCTAECRRAGGAGGAGRGDGTAAVCGLVRRFDLCGSIRLAVVWCLDHECGGEKGEVATSLDAHEQAELLELDHTRDGLGHRERRDQTQMMEREATTGTRGVLKHRLTLLTQSQHLLAEHIDDIALHRAESHRLDLPGPAAEMEVESEQSILIVGSEHRREEEGISLCRHRQQLCEWQRGQLVAPKGVAEQTNDVRRRQRRECDGGDVLRLMCTHLRHHAHHRMRRVDFIRTVCDDQEQMSRRLREDETNQCE